MASADSVQNGHSDVGSGLSAAQKLQKLHEDHNATVEEVVDEADLKHSEEPVSSSILEAPGDEATPGWVQPVSAKAAGKRKEEQPAKGTPKSLDINEESFPTLGGGPKPKQPAAINSNWKMPNKTGPNASNGANGNSSNGLSTPNSEINTPPYSSGRATFEEAPRKMNIPGQAREDFFLAKDFMLPRQALKKPLPDILKEINRKSKKVNVTYSAGANGGTLFSATGPSREAAQQALKEVLSQVGARVHLYASPLLRIIANFSNRFLQRFPSHNRLEHISLESKVLELRNCKRELAPEFKYRKQMKLLPH